MIPVKQTKRGGRDVPPAERGDCLSACFASLLEVPIGAVPIPHSDDPDVSWWQVMQEAVAPHGYEIAYVYPDAAYHPAGWWVASVPSKNLGPDVRHVVVMSGRLVAHDPCLGDTYPVGTHLDDLGDVTNGYALIPLNPVSLERAA